MQSLRSTERRRLFRLVRRDTLTTRNTRTSLERTGIYIGTLEWVNIGINRTRPVHCRVGFCGTSHLCVQALVISKGGFISNQRNLHRVARSKRCS
jgi:hypothetical protein